MEWKKLLSSKRVGELFGKPSSEDDPRTPFERDHGRVIFSTPLRRLQDKTQVFPLEEHDSIRTRLTHSLEVSSVARNLGRLAGEWIKKQKDSTINPFDLETIAATCGIIHDFGNPPFGHSGEDAIRDWFSLQTNNGIFEGITGAKNEHQYRQDFLNWEGNAQTLRLISKLQVLSDFHGLNLTCATFSAACKYSAASDKVVEDGSHRDSKIGYFASETDTVREVRNEVETGEFRNPITLLVEAADDIVYATGDIEDGIRKKLMTWPFLCDRLTEMYEGELLKRMIEQSEKKVSFSKIRRNDEEAAQMFRTLAIHAMVTGVLEQFKVNYDLIMKGDYDTELIKADPDVRGFVKACKKVGAEYVYPSHGTVKLELMGRKVIHDLMDILWEGAQKCGDEKSSPGCGKGFPRKAFSLISQNYQKVFQHAYEGVVKEGKLPERYCRLQMVTDQIAGMTDTYAAMLHKRLMNG